MHINRENYMAFFLDYHEGTLSGAQQEALMRFLEDHPDLKAELYDFEMVQLPGEALPGFPDKDSLKKTGQQITADNYESFFAAFAEGDLDAKTAASVEAFASKDPFYIRELSLMQAARLEADPSVQYPRKPALKKFHIGMIRRKAIYYVSAAAAILLFAVVAFSLFPLRDTAQIARETPVAGDQEVPEAVAETPGPQQDAFLADIEAEAADGTLPARPADEMSAVRQVAELPAITARHEAGTETDGPELARASVGGPLAIDLTAFRRSGRTAESLPGLRMPATAATEVQTPSATKPDRLDAREEFIWMAYRDPSEVPAFEAGDDDDETILAAARQQGLGELALVRLEESTGLNRERVDDLVRFDRASVLDLVNEGAARIAPASGNLLGIQTTRNEDGRIVHFAIGDSFTISRK